MSRIPYLVDAHTGAFVDERWQSTMFLHRFFSRRAATTIVTNSHLEAIVKSWGAESLIVADVPVCFAEPTKETLEGKFNMVFVSSFTKDEPLELFLQAAARLPQIHFYVTGDIKNADPSLIEGRPANVSFTGFLPDERYVGLLQASDAVICLTTFDHTMQRGAYEAVYLGKPVITSNFGVLREAFNKGAVHVDNTVEDMVRGVQNLLEDLEKYRDEVLRLRDEKLVRWEEVASKLHNLTEG
jgi:glycosyltransferase involved in cell wall biosynthesis